MPAVWIIISAWGAHLLCVLLRIRYAHTLRPVVVGSNWNERWESATCITNRQLLAPHKLDDMKKELSPSWSDGERTAIIRGNRTQHDRLHQHSVHLNKLHSLIVSTIFKSITQFYYVWVVNAHQYSMFCINATLVICIDFLGCFFFSLFIYLFIYLFFFVLENKCWISIYFLVVFFLPSGEKPIFSSNEYTNREGEKREKHGLKKYLSCFCCCCCSLHITPFESECGDIYTISVLIKMPSMKRE